ncbi:hypothetical protein L4174_023985 (plasmid) [Photobacterium sp. CCB-ST2H9]|uniref:hypothetical protein n=1 Tax=Photobacterium sp. CCB-ST2H9 TaxID=2912855 RepID=UPI002006D717|nr:hypothetical protein [Photobacterium sp. CCB-ST2H9]UTM60447.1 hypothetical protein L4174_023985 [Photobacterium sp. CCB-ST2H9]
MSQMPLTLYPVDEKGTTFAVNEELMVGFEQLDGSRFEIIVLEPVETANPAHFDPNVKSPNSYIVPFEGINVKLIRKMAEWSQQ